MRLNKYNVQQVNEKNKFNGSKNQWIIVGAATLMAMVSGMAFTNTIKVHADDNPDQSANNSVSSISSTSSSQTSEPASSEVVSSSNQSSQSVDQIDNSVVSKSNTESSSTANETSTSVVVSSEVNSDSSNPNNDSVNTVQTSSAVPSGSYVSQGSANLENTPTSSSSSNDDNSSLSSASSNATSASITESSIASNNNYLNDYSVLINGQYNQNDSNATDSPDTDSTYKQNTHLTESAGFMNDIQTMFKDSNGTWHVYYLDNPEASTQNGNSGWKQATTTDFIHWNQDDNLAIAPQGQTKNGQTVPWGSVATGSVIQNTDGLVSGIPKSAVVAYFASYQDNQQKIYAAYSVDNGNTFVPLQEQPIMAQAATNNGNGNFRDPSVMVYNNQLIMHTAEGQSVGTYSSTNGIDWTYQGSTWIDNKSENGGQDLGMIECPVIKQMRASDGTTQWEMFFGGNQYLTGQTTGTFAINGQMESNGFFKIADGAHPVRLDQGTDFYGANFGQDNLNSVYMMGWVNNWGYSPQSLPGQNDTNTMRMGTASYVRKMELIKNDQGQYVPQTVKMYTPQESNQVISTTNNQKFDQTVTTQPNAQYDFTFNSLNSDATSNVAHLVFNYGDSQMNLDLDLAKGSYTVNRTTGSYDKEEYSKKSYSGQFDLGSQLNKQHLNVQVFTDRQSIEVYFPDYHQTATFLRIANDGDNNGKQTLHVWTDNKMNTVFSHGTSTLVDPDAISSLSDTELSSDVATNDVSNNENGHSVKMLSSVRPVVNSASNYSKPTNKSNSNAVIDVESSAADLSSTNSSSDSLNATTSDGLQDDENYSDSSNKESELDNEETNSLNSDQQNSAEDLDNLETNSSSDNVMDDVNENGHQVAKQHKTNSLVTQWFHQTSRHAVYYNKLNPIKNSHFFIIKTLKPVLVHLKNRKILNNKSYILVRADQYLKIKRLIRSGSICYGITANNNLIPLNRKYVENVYQEQQVNSNRLLSI